MHISKSKRCFNVKSSTYYFHMKTKILADFYIYISVPLRKSTRTTKKISFLLKENFLLSTLLRRVLFFPVFGINGAILNLPVEKGCNSESSIVFRKAAYLNESLGVVILLRLNTKERKLHLCHGLSN